MLHIINTVTIDCNEFSKIKTQLSQIKMDGRT